MQPSKDEFFHYLPIRDRDVQWGLYVTGAGCCSVAPKSNYPPRRHPDPYQFNWHKGRILPEYQVVFIRRGEGVFESGPTGVKRIRSGSVILTFPGVWHRYHPSQETGWDEYWFGMNGEHLHRLVGQGILAPKNAILEIDDGAEIESECDALMDRVRVEPRRGHSIAAAALQTLATAIEVTVAPPPTPAPAFTSRAAEDDLVAKAIQYIWNHSEQAMNVADVVAQLPTTRRSLERRFRDALGTTILEEIANCRLQRAKQLLVETHLPVNQVAVMSGFSRTQRMNEAFQREEGMSPWAYRRNCRKQDA
jgi:AraC-like DNA-binding protein